MNVKKYAWPCVRLCARLSLVIPFAALAVIEIICAAWRGLVNVLEAIYAEDKSERLRQLRKDPTRPVGRECYEWNRDP